jgi:hypothetical protein
MPRETTKHGARADDRLAAEASDGTELGGPTRLDQPLGDPSLPGEQPPPEPGARPAPVDDATEGRRELSVRQEALERLAGAPFPATRNDLLRYIGPDHRGALAAHLRALPPDLTFEDAGSVATAFGGIHSDE